MRFENNTPIGLIKIKGPLGEKEIEATIDTGAFKSLVSLDLCKELGLHLKEIREVRGVSEKPVRAKIFWAEITFHSKKINTEVVFSSISPEIDRLLVSICPLIKMQESSKKP